MKLLRKSRYLKLKEEHARSLDKKEAIFAARLERLTEKLARANDRANRLLENLTRSNQRAERLKDANIKLAREQILFRENKAVNLYLAYAKKCEDLISDLEADVYYGRGVQTLPAIHALGRVSGGKTICDVIEIPEFSSRAQVPNWSAPVLNYIDAATEGYLRVTDRLVTVGWALEKELVKRNESVSVLPNYRYREYVMRTDILRKKHDLSAGDKIILCANTISSGFEAVILSLTHLPANYHLVTLGNFVSQAYKNEIEMLVERNELSDRVHFNRPVPYGELTRVMSSADIGLIVLDPEIPNHWVSMPNRVFDYLSAGLPMLSPYLPDIDRFINENQLGRSIRGNTSRDWSSGIHQLMQSADEIRGRTARVNSEVNWEAIESQIPQLFYNAESITIVGVTDLSKNNRTMRIVNSLIKHGASVKVACPLGNGTDLDPSVRWVNLDIYS